MSVDFRPHGQAVKTSPSHGEISGSSPLGATKKRNGLQGYPCRPLFFVRNSFAPRPPSDI